MQHRYWILGGMGSLLFALAIWFLPGYLVFALVGLIPGHFSDSCVTSAVGQVLNLAGHDFEFVDIDCDDIAKSDAVAIYVASAGNTRKTAIFKYAPFYDRPLPTIEVVAPGHVLIRIHKLSSIYFMHRRWENLIIDYQIDEIEFPSAGDKTGN